MSDAARNAIEDNQANWVKRARTVLPGGGFGNFDPSLVIREGHGSRVWDENGREYVDYLIGSGPMILGHDNPEVLDVIREQAGRGLTFFANNAAGIELAERICEAVPCAEQIRYVSTGGEADMYAMRLARAYTGRGKILKFEGGYHGMSAEALISVFPDRLENYPNGIPDSAGISEAVRDGVLVAPYNDIEFARQILSEHGHDIAAVIVEPLQRIVPPIPGFLEVLREECSARGIILIFDEVVTGFRLAYGGAQEHYSVTPDLCTLGKIVGGGIPMGVIAGRKAIMDHFDKGIVGRDGFAIQIGTLSGNPLAAAAGLKTLEILRRPGTYKTLRNYGRAVMSMLTESLNQTGIPYQLVGDPVLFDVVFTSDAVCDYRGVQRGNAKTAAIFNSALRARGIFKSPGKIYASLALTEDDLEITRTAIRFAASKISDN